MRRCSVFEAFLPKDVALLKRDNLKICTNTLVTRLDIKKDEDGRLKACGVFFERFITSKATMAPAGSDTYYAKARRDVIICCGTFGSPQLLMLRCAYGPVFSS